MANAFIIACSSFHSLVFLISFSFSSFFSFFFFFFHLAILSTCIISYLFIFLEFVGAQQPRQSSPAMTLAGHPGLLHCAAAV